MPITTAMILAAGRGERLAPITKTTPKPLIEIANKPIIEHLIERLVKAKVKRIIINIAHLAEAFPAKLGHGKQFGAEIIYSPEPVGLYETAGGIIHALPLLGSAPFFVVSGDILTDFNFNALQLKPKQLGQLVFIQKPIDQPGDYSLNQGEHVIEGNSLTYSGISLLHPELFTGFAKEHLKLKIVFDNAIKQQQLSGQIHGSAWHDIGTPGRLAEAKKWMALQSTH